MARQSQLELWASGEAASRGARSLPPPLGELERCSGYWQVDAEGKQ